MVVRKNRKKKNNKPKTKTKNQYSHHVLVDGLMVKVMKSGEHLGTAGLAAQSLLATGGIAHQVVLSLGNLLHTFNPTQINF
jgi:hypothetical protein